MPEKLTPAREAVLAKMQDGKWYNAYELQCSLPTVRALVRMGYIEQNVRYWQHVDNPRIFIHFRIKQGEHSAP
jgi:hypothetical protein